MSACAIKGWCPDAWHPMRSGDGLLVRVKPRLARLTAEEVRGLAAAARRHGSGFIDLTSRANLQLRGVAEAHWPQLVRELIALGLVDADAEREKRRNLLLAPDWQAGDDTHRIATALAARLDELPALPGKFGFAIDAGPAPVLAGEPGDLFIERGMSGSLMVRAAGRAQGAALAPGSEADALIALARWFVETGGDKARRMVCHHAPLPDWAAPAMAIGRGLRPPLRTDRRRHAGNARRARRRPCPALHAMAHPAVRRRSPRARRARHRSRRSAAPCPCLPRRPGLRAGKRRDARPRPPARAAGGRAPARLGLCQGLRASGRLRGHPDRPRRALRSFP